MSKTELSPAKIEALKKLVEQGGEAIVHVATGTSLVKHGYATYIGGRSDGPATSLYGITVKGRQAIA